MWQGILAGLTMVEEEKERRSVREEALRIREEDKAIRREEFEKNYALAQAKFRVELLDKYGQTKVDSEELANLGARLSGVIKDPEVVSKIVGTGNVDQIKNIVDQVESYYDSFLEQNPDGAAAASQSITDIFSNSYEFSDQSQEPVDLSALEGLIDAEVLSGLNLVQNRPGAAVGPRIAYTPRATLSDRNQARQDINAGYQEMVNIEIQTIAESLAEITERLQSSSPEINRDALQADQELLINRRRMITEALERATGDSPTFSPLVSLYGDNFIDSYLGAAPFAITRTDLGPAFVSPPPPTRMTFINEAQARRFKNYGLLNRGDIVIIGGEETVIN